MTSRVAIGSIFRNSEPYLDRYFTQVASLTGWLAGKDIETHLILVEGDSTDDTWRVLQERGKFLMSFIQNVSPGSEITLLKKDHGGPSFGSVDNDIRWRNISKVCNALLNCVSAKDDALVYVESDLIWNRETILHLLEHIKEVDAVAPMCFHQQTGLFYDIWGHRKDGVRFSQYAPYHPGITNGLTTIDSAGSCIVMKGSVARSCRFTPPELGIVGFGGDIREKGFALCLDPSQKVVHP